MKTYGIKKLQPITVTEVSSSTAKQTLIKIGARVLQTCGKEKVKVGLFGVNLTEYDTVKVLTEEILKLTDEQAEKAFQEIKKIVNT